MMMDFQTCWCLVFGLLMLLMNLCQGTKFEVGGKDGWVLKPSEDYHHWATRNRFQVNDTLLFKFKKGSDSVELVTKENFNSCNVKNPIKSLTEGESTFKFERSGAHYFISGNQDHCKKGQKLVVVVLAVRNKKCPPAPTPTPGTPTAPAATPHHPTPTPAHSLPPAPTPTPAPTPSKSSATKSFSMGVTTWSPSMVLGVTTIVVGMLLG